MSRTVYLPASVQSALDDGFASQANGELHESNPFSRLYNANEWIAWEQGWLSGQAIDSYARIHESINEYCRSSF